MALALAIALTACQAPPTPHRQGAEVPIAFPQTYGQCKAQPWLAWCRQ